jgi:exonuclease VII large subunit
MDPEVIKRLVKFIPLLASDQDGEVVAAARAMKRALEAKKLSFHDVVEHLSAGTPSRTASGYTPSRGFAGNPFEAATRRTDEAWAEMVRRMNEDAARERERRAQQRAHDAMVRERAKMASWQAAEDRARKEQEERDAAQPSDRDEWLAGKIEVPKAQLIEECDIMLTKELSLKEQSFLNTLIGLTAKYHKILLSAKQHEWWQTMKMQHGV